MSHSILALELCLALPPGSTLGQQLRQLVVSHPEKTSPGAKWELLRQVSQLLEASERLFVMGCWDFFDDDARALKDYDMWCNGMLTREGARKETSWDPFAPDAPRYMTFTLALLLVNGTQAERALAQVCDIPQEYLWRRSTFTRILRGLSHVNYASVKSDVLYLIPGDPTWALTSEDLTQPKFSYLRPIEEYDPPGARKR